MLAEESNRESRATSSAPNRAGVSGGIGILMVRSLAASAVLGGAIGFFLSCVFNFSGIDDPIHWTNAVIVAVMSMIPGALIAVAIHQRRKGA